MLPATLCDMVWSTGFIESMDSVEAGKDFILDSLQALHPGGVAVHVLDLILEPRADPDHDLALGGVPITGNAAESHDGVVLWHHHDLKQIRDLLCTLGKRVPGPSDIEATKSRSYILASGPASTTFTLTSPLIAMKITSSYSLTATWSQATRWS